VTASDPGFYEDIKAWCKRTNNELVNVIKKGSYIQAMIKKNSINDQPGNSTGMSDRDNKTLIVFSGDLDKAIASFTVSGNSYLLFVIRTPWDYYDPEVFNKILTNKHAQIYEYDYGYVAKVLKRAYCINPDFEVWTDTAVKLDLNARRPQMWESSQCKLMPQVHIMRFDCWGNNKGYIQKALSTGDYIGAIEQIVAATHNINWVDSTVSGIYFDWLSNGFRNRKTIKNLKTGEFISYLDAKNIILDEERQAQLEAEKAKKKAEEERITVEEARLAAEAALAELNRPDVTPEPPAEIAQPTVQEIIAEADRIHEEIQTNPAATQVNEEELIG
jgi:hypothetical protein